MGKTVMLSNRVIAFLEATRGPHESYTVALERILDIPKRPDQLTTEAIRNHSSAKESKNRGAYCRKSVAKD